MAGETSGSDDQELQMVTLEQKFDELLNFVHLMVKRDSEMEDQRKEDNKNDEIPKGHPHANITPPPPTPPRPPTPPKPEGKDS
jgi:hypothetical protein